MDWNYDMESCPLDTVVRLLSANDCLCYPQKEFVGTITFNRGQRHRGECYKGDKDYFYRSAIVAWKMYDGKLTVREFAKLFGMTVAELTENCDYTKQGLYNVFDEKTGVNKNRLRVFLRKFHHISDLQYEEDVSNARVNQVKRENALRELEELLKEDSENANHAN